MEEAHAIHPEPILLKNLGRAYETLGRLEDALRMYERFLDAAADAPQAGAVRLSIAAIETQLRERQRLTEERDLAISRIEDEERETATLEAWGWGLTIGGAVVSAGAAIFGGLSVARERAGLASEVHADRVAARDDAQLFATIANIGFIAGGVLTLVGVPWLLTVLLGDTDPAEVETALVRW